MTAKSNLQESERALGLCLQRDHSSTVPCLRCWLEVRDLCECGHPLAEHADSDWGPQTVCVEQLPDENDGWYGVCPCVRREALGA